MKSFFNLKFEKITQQKKQIFTSQKNYRTIKSKKSAGLNSKRFFVEGEKFFDYSPFTFIFALVA